MEHGEELANGNAIYAEDVKERRIEYEDFDEDDDSYSI